MLDYIGGTLTDKSLEGITVETQGLGYFISTTSSTFEKLPESGAQVKIYIFESTAGMYGGVINLYGFLTRQEREMFVLIKDEVPGTGAKKALEYLDKISKSFADFKAAVISKNYSMLTGVFGFTKKTADKLVAALKDKIQLINVAGSQKWDASSYNADNALIGEAVSALIALGYKEINARAAVNKAYETSPVLTVEELIKQSLKHL
ncbi:MAG: Holliday junction branch migration protein RuvA [Endomicrobium sp.]|jgi:Holliday junction DNA helicase RuvA|nr:Holliday junction branch migration protein RuvA [Endomicrobium sp.]